MKIEVSLGGQRIKEYDLDGEVTGDSQSELILWIGRLESCFIVLEKSQVSREHAKLRYTGGRWEIEVLDSCRPIQVNGKTVETSPLRPNDIIHLSPYMLKVLGEPSIGDQDEGKEEGGLDEEAEDVQEEYSLEDSGEGQESADEYPELEPELKEEAQEQEQEQEQEDYGQEAFEQEHAMEVVDGAGEKTEVVSSFSTFILDIFGEHVPYDTFIIEKDETFIGRDPEKCQIVLPDSEVSSVHAVIKKTKVQITLEDLKSGNGTILNGERINKKELSNGDEFVIGSATFSV